MISWGKGWCSNYTNYLQYASLFDISSYCLFCGNSDKNYVKKDGYEMICVQTLDFQAHVLKACDKLDGERSSCIHAIFENVKEYLNKHVLSWCGGGGDVCELYGSTYTWSLT